MKFHKRRVQLDNIIFLRHFTFCSLLVHRRINFNPETLLLLDGFPRRLKVILTVWEECLRPFIQKRMNKSKGWMFSLLGLFCVLVFVGLCSRGFGYKIGVVAEKSRAFDSSSNWIKIHFQDYVNSALIYPHGPPPL